MQDNLLETVNKHFSPMYSGISHPNILNEIDEEFHVIGRRVGSFCGGIDIRFFDVQLLNQEDVKQKLEKYVLHDWGGIEHLLFGISRQYSNKMINIFEESKVIKAKNDRDAANENKEYILESSKRNNGILKELSYDIGVDYTDLTNLLYIHMQYKLTKNRIKNYFCFRKEWKVWIEQRLNKRKGFFYKVLVTIIHWIL